MAISKDQILDQIRAATLENGGKPPGRRRFENLTGIREHDWLGRYWARWSDALTDAGLEANTLTERLPHEAVLTALAAEVRRLGKFPTDAELRMRRRSDAAFPSRGVFERIGNRAALVRTLITHCEADPAGNGDILHILAQITTPLVPAPELANGGHEEALGYVYLIKSGRYYKIGRTNAIGRRERELAIQLPERASTVHVIRTDDPEGIEHYWHRRFADRRVRRDAEWFRLTQDDVTAFRRRKFQ